MTSGNDDRDRPAPPEGEDRSILFGERGGGRTSRPSRERAAGPAAPESRAPPELAATLADLASGQRRILALQEDFDKKIAAAPDGQETRAFAEAVQRIGEATEWANSIKAAIDAHLATVGRLIAGLKGGQGNLDGTAAALKGREEGLGRQLKGFAGQLAAIAGHLQQLDEIRTDLQRRTSDLATVKQELAGYYKNWTDSSADFRRDINALSERLGEGDGIVKRIRREQDAWTGIASQVLETNAEAHRRAGEEVSANAGKLAQAGNAFLHDLRVLRTDILVGLEKEQESADRWRRRWAMPGLTALFLLAAPTFLAMGAFGQSELGVFDAYDDTRGWKQFVWDRHGEQVRDCMIQSRRTGKVVGCRLKVDDR